MKNSFTEDDKKKTIEFLNFIAQKAEFNKYTTQDVVSHFKLLSFMQQTLLPKIEANILEVIKITETPQENSEQKSE